MIVVGDLAAFSLKQDAAISVCNSARAALVSILDSTQPKKRGFWPF